MQQKLFFHDQPVMALRIIQNNPNVSQVRSFLPKNWTQRQGGRNFCIKLHVRKEVICGHLGMIFSLSFMVSRARSCGHIDFLNWVLEVTGVSAPSLSYSFSTCMLLLGTTLSCGGITDFGTLPLQQNTSVTCPKHALMYQYSCEPCSLGPRWTLASQRCPHPMGHKPQQQPPLGHHFL